MSVSWKKNCKAYLEDLIPYEPGKPIEDVAREWGLEAASIIKLASNENPLGPSPKAREAMRLALEKSHLYPDGGGYHLREGIARKFGLAISNIILGNGSNEVILFLGQAFLQEGDEILCSRHAFAVYPIMATMYGARTIEVADPDFAHDIRAMVAAITLRTKLLFITSPNNPTGTLVPEADLRYALENVPPHIIVVLDEAYCEFLDNPPPSIDWMRQYPNLILLRTFSKIQGLAGLRIGYGIAQEPLITLLQKVRQPFNANLVAQAGALAGLLDDDHQQKTKAITDLGRTLLQDSFRKMNLEFVPSFANFVMVRVGGPGAGKRVFLELQKKGIIVRDMTSYGLSEWIRVSIGTPDQNRRFLDSLPQVL
ncbi:MAG: histidinol-phosphate transaminase [Verrucomicrobiae bacterium]|nr:histidinol-phosphate transaminase [Verrucomicrobiae bacterium]